MCQEGWIQKADNLMMCGNLVPEKIDGNDLRQQAGTNNKL